MKKGFVIYKDWIEYTNEMSDEDAGLLFKLILNYQNDLDTGQIPYHIKIIWGKIKKSLDQDTEKYNGICKTNQENIRERWKNKKKDTTVYDRIPSDTTGYDLIPNDTHTDTDTHTDNIEHFSKEKETTSHNIEENIQENIEVEAVLPEPEGRGKDNSEEKEKSSAKKEKEMALYGNPEINECKEIIKKHNDGLIEGTQKWQGIYCKNLISELKKLPKIRDGTHTWQNTLDILLGIVSENKFYSPKIAGPKKIYENLPTLMQVAKQEFVQKQKSKIVMF